MSARPTPFGDLIADRLLSMERRPAWLATKLGISTSTVGGWIRDSRLPRDSEMRDRLARVLGYSSFGALLQGGEPDRPTDVVTTRGYAGQQPEESEYQDQMLATLRSIDLRLAVLLDELRKPRGGSE